MKKETQTRIDPWKYFKIDGSTYMPTNNPFEPFAAIMMLEDDDKKMDWTKGWYFVDEVQQLNGPFNTFEEAAEAFKNYEP